MSRRTGQRAHFEFALWASTRRRPPSVKEVEAFFGVSRTSAWRIHRNWMQAEATHRTGGKRSETPHQRKEHP